MTIPAGPNRVKQGKGAPESIMQTKNESTVQKFICAHIHGSTL